MASNRSTSVLRKETNYIPLQTQDTKTNKKHSKATGNGADMQFKGRSIIAAPRPDTHLTHQGNSVAYKVTVNIELVNGMLLIEF